ncbi:hypothetical protein QTH11_03570 [Clostridium perfringens]|uniref:HK97 gp10 family phage protein n=1 Tax=Clostridium perfringens TaxID=1502 RepID=A0AAP4A3I1_CLOPF|nr:hypothetical protein [Clostridium perfringens]EHK2327334.1 hypothetical protein [Clostridium perfringens]MDH2334568.1 hypothetical protein [Clostridium perfringens]MDK0685135.1 hypothetical protein [Clostridium perfringens]MDM0465531.1 hypothetical protein [Clostridium perfringens]
MANFTVKGLDKLLNDFEKLADKPNKIKKKIINDAAEETLNIEKKEAPKDKPRSYKYLSILENRIGDGYLFIDVGINKENWEETKGLYYQNYGFEWKVNGENSNVGRVDVNYMWMKKASKKAEKKVKEMIKDGLLKELKL